MYAMHIEWDAAKSANNSEKHGIDFHRALEIWQGYYLEVDGIARVTNSEARGATIGLVGNMIYTAIWTKRGPGIRLISVRQARKNEKEIFIAAIRQRAKDG